METFIKWLLMLIAATVICMTGIVVWGVVEIVQANQH